MALNNLLNQFFSANRYRNMYFLLVVLLIVGNSYCLDDIVNIEQNVVIDKPPNSLLTAEQYSKLFKERRKEHVLITKQMLEAPYEKNYKLLKIAYAKIYQIINNSNDTLNNHQYQPMLNGFPQNGNFELQEAVMLILENCCLAAETVLHFPEMSYRIFKKEQTSTWKPSLNWCIEFLHTLPHIVDETTFKMLEVFRQEINEELRTDDYVNPYYKQPEKSQTVQQQKAKKSIKKLKKGPQLSSGKQEL